MTDGIHIPREVAEGGGVPEELDANVVGPYEFPDPRRRRTAARIYVVTAVVLAVVSVVSGGPVLWVGALVAVLLAVIHLRAAWPLTVDERQALAAAAPAVPFAVGHASAAVTFHGPRSRPRWHVIVYSADDPPTRRALVVLDGVSGERLGETYVEDVPGT